MLDSREPDSDEQLENITKEQQQDLLARAKDAAASSDPRKMLEYLYCSGILDGLTRQIASKWQSLSREEVGDILAEAVDILYGAIRDGKKISNLVAYLWKTSDHKACDYYRARQNKKYLTPTELEHIADKSSEREDELDSFTSKQDWENKKPRIIAIVRSLLPRLGQHNVPKVMAYILDALEADYVDIANIEIAEALGLSPDVVRQSKKRGFDRLERIVREEGLAAQVSDVTNLRRDYEEQNEDEQELV